MAAQSRVERPLFEFTVEIESHIHDTTIRSVHSGHQRATDYEVVLRNLEKQYNKAGRSWLINGKIVQMGGEYTVTRYKNWETGSLTKHLGEPKYDIPFTVDNEPVPATPQPLLLPYPSSRRAEVHAGESSAPGVQDDGDGAEEWFWLGGCAGVNHISAARHYEGANHLRPFGPQQGDSKDEK
jgi:hypothetical protein